MYQCYICSLSPILYSFQICSHDYSLAFGVSMLGLDKSQRLVYGQSMMTHAMVFTGLSWEVRTYCWGTRFKY